MSILFAGCPAGIAFIFSSDFFGTIAQADFHWNSFWAIIALGSVGTAFAVALFTKLVQMTDVVFSSSVTYIMPVVALSWGLFSGETIQWLQIVGLVVIISGVYLINYKKKAV
jgi:drug/metabolite transporter (DMT)-like permease